MQGMDGVRRATAAALLGALVAVSGCAVMSKDDCRKADWRQLGLSDASRGMGPGHLDERRRACARNGISADTVAYGAGYAEGQRLYCTRGLGQETGARGDGVPPVCEGADIPAFSDGYALGLQSFCTPMGGYERGRSGNSYLGQCPPETTHRVMIGMRLGTEVHELNQRLAGVQDGMRTQQAVLDDGKATPQAKRDARRRLNDLRDEEAAVRAMLGDAELRATRLRSQ